MDYKQIDFAKILGQTDRNGHWRDIEDNSQNMDEQTGSNEDNMYMFEGVNYREVTQKADVDLFDRLVLNDGESNVLERTQRRQLNDEEKAARTAKMLETKARRKQEIVREKEFDLFRECERLCFFRKKRNDNVKKDDELNYKNYGKRIIINRLE